MNLYFCRFVQEVLLSLLYSFFNTFYFIQIILHKLWFILFLLYFPTLILVNFYIHYWVEFKIINKTKQKSISQKTVTNSQLSLIKKEIVHNDIFHIWVPMWYKILLWVFRLPHVQISTLTFKWDFVKFLFSKFRGFQVIELITEQSLNDSWGQCLYRLVFNEKSGRLNSKHISKAYWQHCAIFTFQGIMKVF